MLSDRKLLWPLLAICATVAFVAFAYPMYVIRPFRAQGRRELAAALLVRQLGPFFATLAATAAIAAAAVLWRRSHWTSRAGSSTAALMTVLFAALSHVNVYELMFHRIDALQSVPAHAAKVDGDDMVLAVHVAGHSRAYPIRMMGYHHIANDWVGGTPIAATY